MSQERSTLMYFTIRGRVDGIEDTAYPRKVNKGKPDEHEEMVPRYSLTLSVPGMSELVRCDLDPQRVENMPAIKVFDQWELDETWVVVEAEQYRIAKGDTDGRAWALVSFTVISITEMSAQDRQKLVDARRKAKAAEKRAAKTAKTGEKASAA
jgi:hypothetical protein